MNSKISYIIFRIFFYLFKNKNTLTIFANEAHDDKTTRRSLILGAHKKTENEIKTGKIIKIRLLVFLDHFALKT